MPAKTLTNEDLRALKKAKILRDMSRAQSQLDAVDAEVESLQRALELGVGSDENFTLYAMKHQAYTAQIAQLKSQRDELLPQIALIEIELKKCIAHEKA